MNVDDRGANPLLIGVSEGYDTEADLKRKVFCFTLALLLL
nr:MAG TPA: hypothetical protein [Caudoviricetes sp.]